MKLEKIIAEAVENILHNNFEIIDKMVVRITEDEVRKVLAELLGDRVRDKVREIINDHSQRIIERSQEILLVYDGGDSDLKEVDSLKETDPVPEYHKEEVKAADARNKLHRKKAPGED
jgi:hypothetical protein